LAQARVKFEQVAGRLVEWSHAASRAEMASAEKGRAHVRTRPTVDYVFNRSMAAMWGGFRLFAGRASDHDLVEAIILHEGQDEYEASRAWDRMCFTLSEWRR
jgi:hypothetical protein